jgi:hypothetical protein
MKIPGYAVVLAGALGFCATTLFAAELGVLLRGARLGDLFAMMAGYTRADSLLVTYLPIVAAIAFGRALEQLAPRTRIRALALFAPLYIGLIAALVPGPQAAKPTMDWAFAVIAGALAFQYGAAFVVNFGWRRRNPDGTTLV